MLNASYYYIKVSEINLYGNGQLRLTVFNQKLTTIQY